MSDKIYIGEKNGSLVPQHILESVLGMAAPKWFDGSHLYCRSGKFEWRDGEWNFLHNLSDDGIFNHFTPCEYTAYNQACLDEYNRRKEEEERKRLQREEEEAAKKEAARIENQRWQARADMIDKWVDSQKTKGKKGTYEISLADGKKVPREGTLFGYLAYGKNDSGKGWTVTHVPSGMAIGSFDNQKESRRYIFAMNAIMDWKETPEYSPMYTVFRRFRQFIGVLGMEIEEIDELADFVESLSVTA